MGDRSQCCPNTARSWVGRPRQLQDQVTRSPSRFPRAPLGVAPQHRGHFPWQHGRWNPHSPTAPCLSVELSAWPRPAARRGDAVQIPLSRQRLGVTRALGTITEMGFKPVVTQRMETLPRLVPTLPVIGGCTATCCASPAPHPVFMASPPLSFLEPESSQLRPRSLRPTKDPGFSPLFSLETWWVSFTSTSASTGSKFYVVQEIDHFFHP